MSFIHQMPALPLKEHKPQIMAWNSFFDFTIVKKIVYCKTYSNYDCGYILVVFIGIDDSIQILMDETNPFGGDNEENLQIFETTENDARNKMKQMDKEIEAEANSDWTF